MLTFGMGLALAIATISVFSDYQNRVIDTTKEKQIDMVNSEIRHTIFHLKSADSGNIEVDLPEDIAGSDYSLSLDRGVRLSINTRTYRKEFPSLTNNYNFEGSAEGGTVTIYKQEDNFVLRSG